MTDYTKDKNAALAKEQRAENMAVLEKWLREKHPEIRFCEAVVREFDAYLDLSDMPVDFSVLDFALGNMGSRLDGAKQAVPTEAETKAALIDEIIRLLATGGKYTQFDLQTERKRLSVNQWTVEKLTQRRNEIVRAQAAAKKPLSQLKAEVAEARKEMSRDSRKYVGFPNLPEEIVPKGRVRAVPCDAAYLRGLNASELRDMCRRFSVPQINDRLSGR